MVGLVPTIHASGHRENQDVDTRDTRGHDNRRANIFCYLPRQRFTRDEPRSSGQRRNILQILASLPCAPFVAGLVLGSDQRVRAAASFDREVKVADRVSDLLLDITPPSLDRLQAPLPLIRREQEHAECATVTTGTFERVNPGPVAWRLQQLRDAPAHINDTTPVVIRVGKVTV